MFAVGTLLGTYSALYLLPASAAKHAFVFRKNRYEFLVAWREGDTFLMQRYDSLRAAMRGAHESLGLVAVQRVSDGFEIERVWSENRNGTTIVFWKALRFPQLNQITFSDEHEAALFMSSIRGGGYTTSPFGHALLLVPQKSPSVVNLGNVL